jgi:hypothetical protein
MNNNLRLSDDDNRVTNIVRAAVFDALNASKEESLKRKSVFVYEVLKLAITGTVCFYIGNNW